MKKGKGSNRSYIFYVLGAVAVLVVVLIVFLSSGTSNQKIADEIKNLDTAHQEITYSVEDIDSAFLSIEGESFSVSTLASLDRIDAQFDTINEELIS